jgi:hypothetical protein
MLKDARRAMALFRRQLQTLFGDRSSLVLRALLREPDRRWTIPDLAREGVSFGLASLVLNRAEAQGLVARVRTGPGSYSRLTEPARLLRAWTGAYAFDRNPHVFYHYPGRDLLRRLREVLGARRVRYALTLFSASRLISPYVKDDREFLYLDVAPDRAAALLRALESELGLLRLARGGNVCFALPYYRDAVFRTLRPVHGQPLVSDLQLYLDLMGFPPSGPEEAAHLREVWTGKGASLAWNGEHGKAVPRHARRPGAGPRPSRPGGRLVPVPVR